MMQVFGTRAPRLFCCGSKQFRCFEVGGQSFLTHHQNSHNFSHLSSSRRPLDSPSISQQPLARWPSYTMHTPPRQRHGDTLLRCLTRAIVTAGHAALQRNTRVHCLDSRSTLPHRQPPMMVSAFALGSTVRTAPCRIVRTWEPRPAVLLSHCVTKCNLSQDLCPGACSEAVQAFPLDADVLASWLCTISAQFLDTPLLREELLRSLR